MKQPRHFKRRFRSVRPLIRTIGTAGAALAICTGVTYAALQSQKVALANNTIRSATANLQLSTDGVNFGTQGMGFDFNNVEPGGDPVPASGNTFYLKNSGSTTLSLRIALDSNTLVNPDHIDLSKVTAIITPVAGGPAQSYSLLALTGFANVGGGDMSLSLPSGASGQYRVQVAMTADALNGNTTTGTTISGFNLVFSGTSVTAS